MAADNVIGAVFLGLFGMLLLVGGAWQLRRARVIATLPTSPAGMLQPGLVEVAGRAEPQGEPARAPLSGTPCVLYEVRVEERRQSGKSSKWVTVHREEALAPFLVRDASGAVLVRPEDAHLEPRMVFEADSAAGRDPAPPMLQYLQDKGIGFEGLLGINKRMRVREWVLAPGDEVYVLATAAPREEPAGPGESPFVLWHGSKSSLFIISTRPERAVLRSLRLSGIGLGVVGLLLGIGAVALGTALL